MNKTDEIDRIRSGKLKFFLPQKMFDMHAHIHRETDALEINSAASKQWPGEITIDRWREQIGEQVGEERLAGGLFISLPYPSWDREKGNGFVVSELRNNPESRGLIVIASDDTPEQLSKYLDNPQIVGLKPYHLLCDDKPTFQASILSYLPPWAWKLADQRSLVITLHMVKDRALADPDNQAVIREMCVKYPNVKLVLAHAGRGFHSQNTIDGLPALKGLQNIWFDMAAVCEPAAIKAILHAFGPRKLMWGSDFSVSQIRGKCVTVGDGFVWLDEDSVNWDKVSPACHPTTVTLESLSALKEASEDFGLNEDDIDDIFYNNAMRLLGMARETGTLTRDLYTHAKERIPGGTQLMSKRPEMMAPDQWPAYFREARGCETWDLDGRHYYDFSLSGIISCLLGFCDPDVERAVRRRCNLGSMSTLNPPEEVELADILCQLHPWAEQVRFARSGGEMMAAAVRIARAATGRSVVAVCGYHGWHDWYLAANLGEDDTLRGHLFPGLGPSGVPSELRDTTLCFSYNNKEELQQIIDEHGHRLAAIVMEPCRYTDPEPGFLELARDGAKKCGALLIFDEITIGFRLAPGGAHLKYNVNPDMAVFAKALGNGHPIAAVIGTKEAMEGAHTSFISSTYWTESVGPVAAVACLKKMMQIDLLEHFACIGKMINQLWEKHAGKHGVPVVVDDVHICGPTFHFEHELSNELRTLFTQQMLQRGFLASPHVNLTLAHTEENVALYSIAVDEVFYEMADALAKGEVESRLKGPAAHKGFRRLV
jgi:glutamate-1-semialdehyde 2,1-aminomutase